MPQRKTLQRFVPSWHQIGGADLADPARLASVDSATAHSANAASSLVPSSMSRSFRTNRCDRIVPEPLRPRIQEAYTTQSRACRAADRRTARQSPSRPRSRRRGLRLPALSAMRENRTEDRLRCRWSRGCCARKPRNAQSFVSHIGTNNRGPQIQPRGGSADRDAWPGSYPVNRRSAQQVLGPIKPSRSDSRSHGKSKGSSPKSTTERARVARPFCPRGNIRQESSPQRGHP